MSYVLVIEDSSIDREIIAQCLVNAGGYKARFAADAYAARELIAAEDPILIILDIGLPRMSSGEFLGHLMRHYPLPVIAVTSDMNAMDMHTEKFQLLGAVRTLHKPINTVDRVSFSRDLQQILDAILSVRNNAIVNARQAPVENRNIETSKDSTLHSNQSLNTSSGIVIALGASTGGPGALSEIIRHFSANSPPVVIAQHMSDRFLITMVRGLQRLTEMKIAIAEHGMLVSGGRIYLAPPEHHMEVDGGGRIKILSTVPTDKFAPSVNVLFNSLARSRRTSVIAALLTGMGNDGADGLLRLRQTGAVTIAEDKQTCAVFGMPARAIEIGAAAETLPLHEIGPRVLQHVVQFQELRHTKQIETVGGATVSLA